MNRLHRLELGLMLAITGWRDMARDDTGGIGEQTVIRGLIIAGAIVVVGIIVAAIVTHAHSIANSITGAGG